MRRLPAIFFAALSTLISLAHAENPPAQPDPPPGTTWRDITFLARDKATGKPLPNVEIELGKWGPGRYWIHTGPDGTATTSLPLWAKRNFDAEAHIDGYVPLVYWWRPSKNPGGDVAPDTVTFDFETGIKISGTILDNLKQPLPSASVAIDVRIKHTDSWPQPDLQFVTTSADDHGKWSIQIPEKFESLEIGAFHPLCLSEHGFYQLNPVKDLATLRDGSATLELTRGTPITLTVLDPNGQPVANADVSSGSDRVASNALPEFQTDAQGKLTLGIKAGSSATLTVKAKGFGPDLQQLQVPAKPLDLTIRLKTAAVLAGRVVDSKGNPISGVWIAVETWRKTRTLTVNLRTNANGEFTWRDAPEDAVLVDVMKEGYADARNVPMKAWEDNNVTLHGPTEVTGTVSDATTGKPVETFELVQGIDFGDGHISWQPRRNSSPSAASAKDGKFTLSLTFPYPKYILRVEAPGYLPSDSPPFAPDGEPKTFSFKLEKGDPIAGTILAAGKPAANAEVFLVTPSDILQVTNGKIDEWNQENLHVVKTDGSGHFSLPSTTGKYDLFVLADAGFAQIHNDALPKSGEIALTPWARVEGTVHIRAQIGKDQKVQGGASDNQSNRDPAAIRIYRQYDATADANGHYAIERVFPGDFSLGRFINLGSDFSTTTASTKATAESGKTTTCDIGGNGRPLTARLIFPPSLDNTPWTTGPVLIQSKIAAHEPKTPANFPKMSPEERKLWYANWQASDEGKAYDLALKTRRMVPAIVSPDKTVAADEIPPGDYTLQIQFLAPPADNGALGDQIGTASLEFTVPPIPNKTSDEPLDLGPITVKPFVNLKVGDAAPDFTVKSLDGKEFKLSDFHGKFVLLNFWATWHGPSTAEIPNLKAAHEAFGSRPDFVMISLSLDPEKDAPTSYVKENQITWLQGFLGEWQKTDLPSQYGIRSIPSCWLIGPDGKILAKNLRGEQLKSTLEKQLPPK